MRQLLFLLIVLMSGSALNALPAPLQILGPVQQVPPQCSDPTYACMDLENARQCKVVKSCINDVWANMNAPDDNEDICTLCKEMVKEARDQLLSNMTQEELKEVFEGSCRLLPVKLIADGCIKLVDEFIPDLVEMLASRMDPNMVCTVAGLCNLAHLPIQEHFRNLLNLAAVSVNTDKCAECTTIMTEVKSFVSQMSEPDFQQMITKLCEAEVIAPICTTLIQTYASQIYQFIVTTDPKTVCTSANICPAAKSVIRVPLENKGVGDDLVCQFCTNVLEHVKEMITTNTTVEEFRTALLNFCTHLGSYSKECSSFVDDYFDTIFDYIRKLDTKGVCTLAGLCQSGMRDVHVSPLVKLYPAETQSKVAKMARLTPSVPLTGNFFAQPMVKLVPVKQMSKKGFKNDADIETNNIFDAAAAKSQLPIERLGLVSKHLNQNLDCPFCKAVSFFLKQDLKDERTWDGIRMAMHDVCDKWVKEFPSECRLFLQKYSAQVENYIVANGDFDSLCTNINACPLEEKDTGVSVRVISPTSTPAPAEDVCDLCKKVFDEAQSLVKNPDVQKSIKTFLELGCQICPAKQKCINVIDQNIDKLLAVIEKYLEGGVACPALHLCPARRVSFSPSLKNVECELCKNLVQELVSVLQDPQTKSTVQSALEKGCGLLPQEFSAQCKSFVDKNINGIIQMLIDTLNPDMVCATLNICPGATLLCKPVKYNASRCDSCKNLVHLIQNYCSKPSTKENVKRYLENICGCMFPYKFSKFCKQFVDNYTDWEFMFLQGIDPGMLCVALNMCPDSRKVVKPPKSNDLECELCKEVVQKVEDQIKDQKTEEAIKQALDQVCGYLPSSISDKCKSFVDTYTETIIVLLMQELDPSSVCAALGVCKESIKLALPPKSNDLECDLCKEVVQNVVDQLEDQKTEEAIREALEKVCGYLPSSLTDKCKSFVDTYTDTLISLIVQEMNPAQICAALKLCTGSKKVVVPPKSNDLECDLCKEVVQNVLNQLKDQKTEAAIREALDQVCGYLPSSMTAKCKSFVDTYTDMLISLIVQEMDPAQICAALNLCTGSAIKVKLPKDDLECDLCKEVVKMVESELKDKRTEDAIRNALDKVCSLLPSSLSSRCQTFVNTYLELLVTLLAEELDPTMVCAGLKVCPTQDIECESCQYLFHFIQEQLATNDTQAELKNVLKRLCDILPQTFANNCEAFVDEYGASLFMLMAQELDPSVMCPKLGMCPSGKHYTSEITQPANLKSAAIDTCELCTTVVDYVDKYLEDDDVDREITQFVEKVCNIVPASVKDKCSAMIETYGPYILQMIGQIADSKQVCQDIDLCSRPPGHVHLLGAKKCTFGPSYWCSSKAHAVACKAEEFCKHKVWKN